MEPSTLRDQIARALYEDTGCDIPWSLITTDPDFEARALTYQGHADAVMDVIRPEIERLRERIARVKAVHPLERHLGRSVCGSCRDAWEDPMAYPCPTMAALDEPR